MQWTEARHQYPNQWLLIEAIKAHTSENKRHLEELAVIGSYTDSVTAMKEYSKLHQNSPERELYVFHTDRQDLNITERRWLGVRGLT